jgi:hypothetical protein
VTRSKEVLNQFAKIAAEAFLSKSKTALNTTLTKIAKEEALEPHQVEYVASQANHAVWERMYGMDKKASYDFPIADPNVVIGGLQIKPKGIIKEASLDYLSTPSSSTGFLEKTASIELHSVEKTAAKKRELKKTLQNRMDKICSAKEDIEGKMFILDMKYAESEKMFMKEARAMIMEQPFTERGAAMVKIGEFVRSASDDNEKLAKDLMRKLAAVVKGQGLVKEADLKAPEEYINMKMPARIVNGRQSLYITIKTLKDNRQEYDPLFRGAEIVDSSLPELREKIRAL